MVNTSACDFTVGHLFCWTNFVFGGQTPHSVYWTRWCAISEIFQFSFDEACLNVFVTLIASSLIALNLDLRNMLSIRIE